MFTKIRSINNELFYVEFDKGEKNIQEKFCDELGHDIAVKDEFKETTSKIYDLESEKYVETPRSYMTKRKGICIKCGYGNRYWKCSEKESKKYHEELRSLR